MTEHSEKQGKIYVFRIQFLNYLKLMVELLLQVIRFHLLHSDPSEAVVLRLFFPKTQRYDVYVDDVFVPPTNIDPSQYPASYQLKPDDPAKPTQFFPTVNSVGIIVSLYVAELDLEALIFLDIILE